MIKTEQEYRCTRAKCKEYHEKMQKQVQEMKARGYLEDEIRCLTGPTARVLNKSRRDMELYQRLKKGDAGALRELPLNLQLIGLRIFLGISRTELASLLGISRNELAREENNEYQQLTLERYEEILRAMGVRHIPTYLLGDLSRVEDTRQLLSEATKDEGGNLIIG
ncbi:MAG: helix-turn-helix domain-containing protein [Syntrophomonadaceae bacterium]|jgi:DNA-binding XRE family transcriptional regulator|nr:helix-turn-helix transcriptional regulator [Syntrophomonadaceae bacterium]